MRVVTNIPITIGKGVTGIAWGKEITKDLGEKGRERILERYTIAKNINSIEKVYMNLKDN